MFNSGVIVRFFSDFSPISWPVRAGLALMGVIVLAVPGVDAAVYQDTNRLCTTQQATIAGSDATDCIGILIGEHNSGDVNFKDGDDGELNNALLDSKTGDNIQSQGGMDWYPGAFKRDGWQEMAKVDSNASGNLGFTVTPPPGQANGSLSWTTTTALNGTWIVRVKQAGGAVLWLFEGLQNATSGSVTLDVQSGQYSNIALISGRSSLPPTGGGEVPVPSSLLLLSFGGIFMVARRRRQGRRSQAS